MDTRSVITSKLEDITFCSVTILLVIAMETILVVVTTEHFGQTVPGLTLVLVCTIECKKKKEDLCSFIM